MTVSELYELKRRFFNLLATRNPRVLEYTSIELFVDYLANWIYENEKRRS